MPLGILSVLAIHCESGDQLLLPNGETIPSVSFFFSPDALSISQIASFPERFDVYEMYFPSGEQLGKEFSHYHFFLGNPTCSGL